MQLQQQIDTLIEKYCPGKHITLSKDKKSAVYNEIIIPLLPRRNERRFVEMKNLLTDGSVEGISTYRAAYADKENADIYEIIAGEADLCEFLLGEEITQICAFGGEKSINILAKTLSGYVCSFEISTTLGVDDEPIDKHEIIARKGVVCDIVVDTQVHQSSVYLYGKNKNRFTDTDFELYGFEKDDIAIARQCLDIVQKDIGSTLVHASGRAEIIVNAVKKSLENGENVIVGGEV